MQEIVFPEQIFTRLFLLPFYIIYTDDRDLRATAI